MKGESPINTNAAWFTIRMRWFTFRFWFCFSSSGLAQATMYILIYLLYLLLILKCFDWITATKYCMMSLPNYHHYYFRFSKNGTFWNSSLEIWIQHRVHWIYSHSQFVFSMLLEFFALSLSLSLSFPRFILILIFHELSNFSSHPIKINVYWLSSSFHFIHMHTLEKIW